MRTVRVLVATVLGLHLSVPAQAESIAVGAFCLEGVTARDVPNSRQEVANGYWIARDYTYALPASGPPQADIVIFGKAVNVSPLILPTCKNVIAAAQAQGVAIVLQGRLESLNLRLHRRIEGANVTSYLVESSRFAATLGRVTSGLSKIGGGTIDLSGSRAWITSPTQLNVDSGGMSGTLRIESWDRSLENVTFQTMSGKTFSRTLKASPGGNTIFDVDTATGVASLWKANLSVADVALDDIDVTGEAVTFFGTTLRSKRLTVTAESGRKKVSIEDAAGEATTSKLGGDRLQATLGTTALGWKGASADSVVDQTHIAIGAFAFQDLTLQTQTASLTYQGTTMLQGATKGRFASLGTSRVDGTVEFPAPKAPVLAFAIPADKLASATLSFTGTPSALTITAALNANQLKLGNAAFKADFPLKFAVKPADVELRIPFDIRSAPLDGRVEFDDSGNAVIVQGGLKRFELAGDLFLNLGDVNLSRLEIPQNRLNLEIEAAVSVTPYLAGSKPTLAQTGVKASNSSPLTIRPAGATGAIDVVTPLLIIGDPILDVGSGGHPARISVSLKATASATLRYDLAASAAQLVDGNFSLENAKLASSDASFVVDLGGTLIENPSLQIRSLSLQFNKSDGKALVAGSGIIFAGAGVRTAPNQGVRYRGAISAPLTIGALAGRAKIDRDSLGLIDLALRDVSFGLTADKVALGGSTQLNSASLNITAAEIRSVSGQAADQSPANGIYFANLRVQAGGSLDVGGNVSLANQPRISGLDITLNGRSDQLSGDGSASLDGFAGTVNTELDTAFTCSDGNSLKVPMQAQLATGPSALTLEARTGKFKATGSFAGFSTFVHSTAAKQCDSDHKSYDKDPVWGSMTGWCPTWSEPARTCEWKTIIVPAVHIGYRIRLSVWALTAFAAMANPRVAMTEGGVSVCNLGPGALTGPEILADYAPQLDDNGVIAQAINAIVEGVAVATESTIANTLTSIGSIVINDPLVNIYGSANCLIKGEYRAF